MPWDDEPKHVCRKPEHVGREYDGCHWTCDGCGTRYIFKFAQGFTLDPEQPEGTSQPERVEG